ncbi:MAG: hypothetical protein QM754_18605 [Tepidisphaeraceae bacterium]
MARTVKVRTKGATTAMPLHQARAFGQQSAPVEPQGDRGLGDTIARVLDPIGGAAFKRAFKAVTGKDCGCGKRQAALNKLVPYKPK